MSAVTYAWTENTLRAVSRLLHLDSLGASKRGMTSSGRMLRIGARRPILPVTYTQWFGIGGGPSAGGSWLVRMLVLKEL